MQVSIDFPGVGNEAVIGKVGGRMESEALRDVYPESAKLMTDSDFVHDGTEDYQWLLDYE